MSEENGNILDLGSIDFTPAWAKKEAGVNIGKVRPERDEKDRRDRKDDRKPFGDKKPFGERKPFGEKRPFGEKKSFGGKPFDRRPRFEDRPKPLDVEVKVLPETKALGTIIRKLQSDAHAYKLKDLAYFFLDNPSSVLLKITPKAKQGGDGRETGDARREVFYQCKACGFASTKEEDVIEHVVSAHLADYYDSKEVEVEPPKGNFNCVAKCGLSGVLLGPPNIHEFNAVVKEMIRTKYPDMSEVQYRAHIEMVRDSDTIEEWRKSATKKTMFFAKGTADQEGAQALTREQAEGEFKRNVLPSMLDTPKNLMITAEVAMKSPVKPLQWAANDALQAERRAPYNMCFALRGAFHHRKLKFFRANDAHGQEFVTNIEYKEFDAAHAIPELAQAAKFVAEHPCCDKSEFPQDVPDFEKHIEWLVTTGHVVAFTNGVFSAVEKFPKYGPQWKKRKPADAAAESGGSTAKTEAAPVAESGGSTAKTEAAPVGESADGMVVADEKENVPSPSPATGAGTDETKNVEVKDETAAQLAE